MKTTLSILLVLYFQMSFTHGKRDFEINLDSINCTMNPKYVSKSEFYIDKTMKHPQAFADIQMAHGVQSMTYSLKIELLKTNKDKMTLIDIKNADGCAFLDGKIEANLINIYRDMLAEAGNLPKCPIPADYHFVFNNVTIDVERFPPFLPEAKFTLTAKTTADKEFFYTLQVNGSIKKK
ncbi:uncharacterized protein LOC129917918 [Episyrphus balteatus]|uniref:uncharacterized protein LOC129917918 n=1 Tax=Episyrphus balteatus TaxID=286459 RepID=UPI00248509D8|nr:uncharacterized protein LOC129917918 [Episyrphus balteatus]